MKIPAERLGSALQKGLLPCYLISGDEPLLAQEALDAVRAAARKNGFDSRESFVQTTGFDWNELSAAAGNLSLFAEKRVIELRLPTGKPGVKGSAAIASFVQEFATRNNDELLFIVSAPKLDRSGSNAKWAKALQAAGGFVQVWPIGPRDMPGWIAARMKTAGLNPDRDAVRLLADRVEGNLLAAQQEIEKLWLLNGAGPVTAQDVDAAVADSSRYDVYKLVDATVSGNVKRALKILTGVRAEGIEPVIVAWALTREVRTLSRLAADVQAGTELGRAMAAARVWSSRQGMTRACLSRISADTLLELLQLLHIADSAAKGQRRADPWQLLTDILLRFSGAAAVAA